MVLHCNCWLKANGRRPHMQMAVRIELSTIAVLFLVLLQRGCATPLLRTGSAPPHSAPEEESKLESDQSRPAVEDDDWEKLKAPALQREGDTLAYSLWNETVANESDARLACEDFSAWKNATAAPGPRQGSCRVEYQCDYNPNRFPEILVSVTCSYDFCTLDGSPPRIVRQCLPAHRGVIVLVYKEPEKVARISSDGEDAESSDNLLGRSLGGSQRRDAVQPGTWGYYKVPVNYACVCSE